MFEVEIVNQARSLLELYESEYWKYYRTKPIVSASGVDHTFLKDVIRQLGFEKAKAIISEFFLTPNDWFKKKAHSLDTLRTNLNVVNSNLSKNARNVYEVGSDIGVKIRILMYCDHCEKGHNQFEVDLYAHEIDKRQTLCQKHIFLPTEH